MYLPPHLACLRPVLPEDTLWHMWVCELASRFVRATARRRSAAVVIQWHAVYGGMPALIEADDDVWMLHGNWDDQWMAAWNEPPVLHHADLGAIEEVD